MGRTDSTDTPYPIDEALAGAVTALLWTTPLNWETGEMMDASLSQSDVHPVALDELRTELVAFQEANADDIATTGMAPGQLGHDFILTRNHHGAGFWDRGYPQLVGDRLTAAAEDAGQLDAIIGDDGKVYFQ